MHVCIKELSISEAWMGNTAHLLNKAAGIEMIASLDHPLVLSSGIHHGTTVQWAARARSSSFSGTQCLQQQQSIPGQLRRRLAVGSEQHSRHILIEASVTFWLEMRWFFILIPEVNQSPNLILTHLLVKLLDSSVGQSNTVVQEYLNNYWIFTFTDI